jgi:NAD(P)-dependent dehydrogenase (short-subunit alcohol dehydrogenase family)
VPNKNKIALITGANGFLGQHLSRMFLDKGFSLILLARKFDEDFKESLQNNCNEKRTIDFFPCDLLNQFELDEIIEKIKKKYQSINLLINNAATQNPINYFESLKINEWRLNIELNLNVPVRLCNDMIPLLKNNSFSSIINISGGGASGPRQQFSPYAASKTALVRFTEIVALELEKYDIHINAVAPGVMPSNMMRDIQKNVKVNDDEKQVAKKSFSSSFNLDEILDLFYFLSSNDSKGITGRLISAKWDKWKHWSSHIKELKDNDLYTLRRVIGRDKGMNWGDK